MSVAARLLPAQECADPAERWCLLAMHELGDSMPARRIRPPGEEPGGTPPSECACVAPYCPAWHIPPGGEGYCSYRRHYTTFDAQA